MGPEFTQIGELSDHCCDGETPAVYNSGRGRVKCVAGRAQNQCVNNPYKGKIECCPSGKQAILLAAKGRVVCR